jgi:3D (Asp-Asp-Asp) domain-containing protein
MKIIAIIISGVCVWMACSLPMTQVQSPEYAPADKIRAEAAGDDQPQPPMPGVWYSVVMNVSSYCGCEKCTGAGSPGVTASGSRIGDVSHFVAAPPEYPFGTVMRVPGYCETPVVVLDRGGSIKGDMLDVFYPTHQAAREFGRQENLTVEIWKGQEK